jgi:hypothetical protein
VTGDERRDVFVLELWSARVVARPVRSATESIEWLI